jgi:hypothetical protein
VATRKRTAPVEDKSFIFRDVVNVLKSTGHKASNLRELGVCITAVSEESIFHHTYPWKRGPSQSTSPISTPIPTGPRRRCGEPSSR